MLETEITDKNEAIETINELEGKLSMDEINNLLNRVSI